MKKKIINFLQIPLLIIIAWSVYKIYDYQMDNKSYNILKKDYSSRVEEISRDIIDSSDDDIEEKEIQAGREIVESLNKRYPEVIGRIFIENLDLDFPIVQGKDNSFYLDHDYTGTYHPFGSVFMDARNSNNFSDQNTILYGHNVSSGLVFNALNKYRDREYVEKNPYIIVDSLEGRFVYKIFAVYDVGAYEDYRSKSYNEDKWSDFLSRIKDKNILDYPLPKFEDKILTLSTCSYLDDRMTVQAVLQK
ncbi:class B sortase [Granulicatella elegans]|nr:class B sortase [Granulicatella elegans]